MKKQLFFLCIIFIMMLTGCANTATTSSNLNNSNHANQPKMEHDSMNSDSHSGSGEIPPNLEKAKNPTFKVGSEAIVNAEHMEGMKGAVATIKGAYDTIAYVISYTPTTGGPMMKNHKWVIQEELKNAGSQMLKPGTKVTIEADHMKGMKGAAGVIESGVKTTVYMVDYTPTNGGKRVINHKWVVESELKAK